MKFWTFAFSKTLIPRGDVTDSLGRRVVACKDNGGRGKNRRVHYFETPRPSFLVDLHSHDPILDLQQRERGAPSIGPRRGIDLARWRRRQFVRYRSGWEHVDKRQMATSEDNSVLLASGHRMPLVGLGLWQTSGQETVASALEAALDAGYRHFDTAFAYRNETEMGKVLHKFLSSGKVKREELFITTKLPSNANRPENVECFFEKSRSSLQLEYVDLYLLHSPMSFQRVEDDNETMPMKDGVLMFDTEVDIVQTWKAMEKLVRKGRVRSIGLSNCNSKQVQRIYDAAEIKPVNLQVECHAYLPQYELYEFCRKLNVTFTAYAPIGSPSLPEFFRAKFGREIELERLLDDPKPKSIAEKHHKTVAQVLLRYLIQRNIAVIPKSSNPGRIKENIDLFDFSLSDEDMEVLKSMGKNYRYFTFDFSGSKENPEYPFGLPY